jgi:hypothetical protein
VRILNLFIKDGNLRKWFRNLIIGVILATVASIWFLPFYDYYFFDYIVDLVLRTSLSLMGLVFVIFLFWVEKIK